MVARLNQEKFIEIYSTIYSFTAFSLVTRWIHVIICMQKSLFQGCLSQLADGLDYDEVRELVKEFGFTAHIRSRGEEAKDIKMEAGKKARRWVVERTHSWNRFRRILIRWEKRAETYIAMLHFVCGIITWRATGLLG